MDSLRDMLLATFLISAVLWDLAERRIPNLLVAVFAVAGLVTATVADGGDGALRAVAGLATGLGLLFLPFASGFVGGGDAKFFAAVGAFLGPSLVFRAFLFGTALGMPLALFALCRARGGLGPLSGFLASAGVPTRVDPEARPVSIPYAVPLALGAFLALALVRAGAIPF